MEMQIPQARQLHEGLPLQDDGQVPVGPRRLLQGGRGTGTSRFHKRGFSEG